jgi:hypothetical protein
MPTGLLEVPDRISSSKAPKRCLGFYPFDLNLGHESYNVKEPGRWQRLPETSSEGVPMSDIPYPDTPQPDIPVPPQPDLPTPVPETEPEPDKEPDLLPPEPSEPPGDGIPKVG